MTVHRGDSAPIFFDGSDRAGKEISCFRLTQKLKHSCIIAVYLNRIREIYMKNVAFLSQLVYNADIGEDPKEMHQEEYVCKSKCCRSLL